MTEDEWLACDEPQSMQSMLRRLGERVGERKRRLYACACCRRVWASFTGDHDREAIGVTEQFADRLATRAEFRAARRRTTAPAAARAVAFDADYASAAVGPACAALAGYANGDPMHPKGQGDFDAAVARERAAQARLLRDIFGNPFRPVTADPSWRTPTVVTLASQMYDSRDFTAMPILADALQEAGCDNDDVLNHCRDAKATHVRGCWVVDLVLGME